MKKRLRKKLHKGEFREFGFEVRLRTVSGLDEKAFDEFVDAFLDEAMESRGLAFGGGGRIGGWAGFVYRFARGGAAEDDRDAVRQWLERHPTVENAEIGELVDAWYTKKGKKKGASQGDADAL